MALKLNANVDLTGMKEVVRGLQKVTGLSFKEIIEAEAGHILQGAIKNTRSADIKKIVRRTMPEGVAYRGAVGERKVQVGEDGHTYHVGIPVVSGRGIYGGFKFAYPKKRWVGQKGNKKKGAWKKLLTTQRKKTTARALRRGLSASQFFWMAQLLKIKLAKQPARYISKSSHLSTLKHFLRPKKGKKGLAYEVTLKSTGFKMSKVMKAQATLEYFVKVRKHFFLEGTRRHFGKNVNKYISQKYPLLKRR
jgi:hypothetical protein